MKFQCASCETTFRWKPNGEATVACPECGRVFPIPAKVRQQAVAAAVQRAAAARAQAKLAQSQAAAPGPAAAETPPADDDFDPAEFASPSLDERAMSPPRPPQAPTGAAPPTAAAPPAAPTSDWEVRPLEDGGSLGWWRLSLCCSVSLLIHAAAIAMLLIIVVGIRGSALLAEMEAGLAETPLLDEEALLDVLPEQPSEDAPSRADAVSVVGMTPLPNHMPSQPVAVVAEAPAATSNLFQMANVSPDTLTLGFDDGGVQVVAEESQRFRVMGSVEEAVGGVVGEIQGRLQEGNLLVLWLFDASNSLNADRAMASRYLQPLLKELEGGADGYRVQHCAVAFGAQHREIMAMTDNSERLLRAARAMPNDPSGLENVLDALGHSASYYRKKWDGRIMIVIWTDESGDDLEHLESAIALCQQERVAVTIVGAAASFGRGVGQQRYSLRNEVFYLPVRKGPESAVPDRVSLPAIHHDGPVAYYHARTDIVSSGFGPYGLVRLARETGGSYLIYDRDEKRAFNPQELLAYAPDYRAASEIEASLAEHPLRAAVVQAAKLTANLAEARLPKMHFYWTAERPYRLVLYPDFGARLARDLAEEFRYAETVSAVIDQALQVLGNPQLEADYSREQSARWRAAYDLARGELLAASLQYREYGLLCQQLLSQGLKKADTNQLTITRGGPLRSGAWGEERLAEANRSFARCQADHAGTPWAQQAKPLHPRLSGYTWTEQKLIPAGGGGGGGGGGPSLPRL